MENLFSSLFKYTKKKEEKSSLENFITEALRYLLEIDKKILEFIFAKCECDKKQYFDSNFTIESQIDIGKSKGKEKNITDILIKNKNNSFAVIIENKIDSPFDEKQIKAYEERAKNIWQGNFFILSLLKNKEGHKLKPNKSFGILYWSELARFLEDEYLQNDKSSKEQIVFEFLNFLKEERMARNKVKWYLIDGLIEKENFLDMLENVLTKYENNGLKKRKRKVFHPARGWSKFEYQVEGVKEETRISLFHKDATLYFYVESDDKKYADFEKHPIFKNCPSTKFDLRKESFFNLEMLQQEEKLSKFIKKSIEKFQKIAKRIK